MEKKDVNEVCLIGKRTMDFRFSHRHGGERFYITEFVSDRNSGTLDRIPVMVSARQCDVLFKCKDDYVRIIGQFRSFNRNEQGRRRLILSVFAETLDVPVEGQDFSGKNEIYLEGYVCKETVYRTTPAGLKITDILLAVNRPSRETDYLPCISWGRYAKRAAEFSVGERIWLNGRIQSRDYFKRIDGGRTERRTAYEVSAYGVGYMGTKGICRERWSCGN